MVVEGERVANTTLGHYSEAHGVGEREVLVVVSSEPVSLGGRFELARAPNDDVRRLTNRLEERERGSAANSPQQQGVGLGDDEVCRHEAAMVADQGPQG